MGNARIYLSYYKQKLERIREDDEDMILETIYKLSKPAVTAEILQDTGIYKSLHKLTKRKGKIAEEALPLFNKWKLLISIAMKEKASLKNCSPLVEAPYPTPANHSSKPQPDSTRNREVDSKCPDRSRLPTRNDQFAPDSTQDRNSSHRSRDSHADRASRGHPKDHSVQEFDAARSGSSSHRGSRQREDFAPAVKALRNPSHLSSDSDSEKGFKLQAAESERYSKFRASRRDLFTPGDETNIFGNPCPRTVPDNYEMNSRLNLYKKELFDAETSAVSNSGDPERRSSDHKDYLAPNPDTTRPSSGSSELNGVCSSQDSNHMDIDSLSNPNLNIEAPQNSSAGCNADSDSSPTKSSKILEPYHIEMKEGMFRAVKNHNNTFNGKLMFEAINSIIKGNSTYRREKDKFDDQKCNEATFLPKEHFGASKEPKLEPAEPSTEKSGIGPSGSSKHDLKRKSSSPCPRGGEKRLRQDKDSDHRRSEKRVCPDSTSDHKLKIKKEEKFPSQAHKPINNTHAHQSNCDRNKNSKLKDSPENAAMEFISSKKERRCIYSGKKCVQEVSTLLNSCQRFLKKNLDCVRGPKHVPYEVLHPILETLNPSQLSKVEEHNQYLLPHTNGLWKKHCNRDYRGLRTMKNEKDLIWKDEYNRAHDQQKKKLKNLTASISAAASKAKPDRQAKLTLVDTQHDPLRRRSKAVEVPIASLKPTNTAIGPKASSPALGHKSTSPALTSKTSPTPRPSFATKPSMPVIITTKPKETKHTVAHKPVKKVVAPLMSKVKKSMGFAYRQK